MKIRYRILALAMSAMMVLSFMPAMAFAQDGAQENAAERVKAAASEQNAAAAAEDNDVVNIVSPVEIEPQFNLEGIVGTNELKDPDELYTKGCGFIVKYDDGSEREFWYDTRTFEQSGEKIEISAFFPRDEEGDNLYYLDAYYEPADDQIFRRGDNCANVAVYPPYYINGEGTLGTRCFSTDVMIWCQFDEPVSLEFKPAEGFMATGFIGQNYLFEDAFYGEGNEFKLTTRTLVWNPETEQYDDYMYTDHNYIYQPDNQETGRDAGFYEYWTDYPGKEPHITEQRLDLGYCGDAFLNPGLNTVQLDYITSPVGTIDTFVTDFEVTMKAEKYDVYGNYPVFEYTGKPISSAAMKKKLVITDSEGNKIPAAAYSFSEPGTKDIGFYELKVDFDTKTYPEYPETISVSYRIGPKVPQIKSVKGGKKQLTVKWDKLKASELKNIDGMYIEIATNKSLTSNYKAITLNKNQVKKGSKVIKNLKKNKKYYVMISTFKKVKDPEYGGNYYIFSPDSKVKNGKTKK